MNSLDGKILFAFICSLILAWIGSLIIGRLYNSRLLSLMQTGAMPDATSAVDAPDSSLSQNKEEPSAPAPGKQNKLAVWRLRIVIGGISLAIAVVITIAVQLADVAVTISGRRSILLVFVYIWPLIPCIGLLERRSSWWILRLSLLYMLIVYALVLLNSYESQSQADVLIWLFGQQLPLLAVVIILTTPGIRSVGPYLLIVFLPLVGSSLIAFDALALSLEREGAESGILDIAEISNPYIVLILFGLAPWLIAFFPLRLVARMLAKSYQLKYFSEPLYLVAGVWFIVLLFQAMLLSHSIGFAAYLLLFTWIAIPVGFFLAEPLLRPRHHPSILLLLRVFRSDNSIGELYDHILERWRYSGNTIMIAGKDLAQRTLEPDELFSFASGQLQDRFINDRSRLQQQISTLDLDPDPDGRFRVNEFFCFDTTWKMVLDSLVAKAALVLMDLRAYTRERKGCSYELKTIARTPHVQKIVILFNGETEKHAAQDLLGGRAKEVVWVEEGSDQSQLEKRILSALLDEPHPD